MLTIFILSLQFNEFIIYHNYFSQVKLFFRFFYFLKKCNLLDFLSSLGTQTNSKFYSHSGNLSSIFSIGFFVCCLLLTRNDHICVLSL